MQELKPCPFCGGPGRVYATGNVYIDVEDHLVMEYLAECSKCGANTGVRYPGRIAGPNCAFCDEKQAYADAVEGWNRRADAPQENEPPESGKGGDAL